MDLNAVKAGELSTACTIAKCFYKLFYLFDGKLARSFADGRILDRRRSHAANASNCAACLAACVINLCKHLRALSMNSVGKLLKACYLLILPQACEVIRRRRFRSDAYILRYYKAKSAASFSFVISDKLLGCISAVAAVA